MRTGTLTRAVTMIALAATSISPSYAQNEGVASCPAPEIIKFNAPHAGKGPGPTNCYNSCPGTEPYNNNIWGAVTGYLVEDGNFYYAFVREPDGKITEFDAPGASNAANYGTVAYSINVLGLVTGQYQDANATFHGYVRWPDGHFRYLRSA